LDAARADALLSLNILESQAEWNARSGTDRGNFQYAQAQMLIRYLNETYSVNTPIKLIRAIGLGSSVAGAGANVLGVQYFDFERRFTQ